MAKGQLQTYLARELQSLELEFSHNRYFIEIKTPVERILNNLGHAQRS